MDTYTANFRYYLGDPLEEIRQEGLLVRLEDGEYALAGGEDREITRPPGDPIKQTGLATHRYRYKV